LCCYAAGGSKPEHNKKAQGAKKEGKNKDPNRHVEVAYIERNPDTVDVDDEAKKAKKHACCSCVWHSCCIKQEALLRHLAEKFWPQSKLQAGSQHRSVPVSTCLLITRTAIDLRLASITALVF